MKRQDAKAPMQPTHHKADAKSLAEPRLNSFISKITVRIQHGALKTNLQYESAHPYLKLRSRVPRF